MLQPLLHDLVSTVMAPTGALSGADGQLRPAGVQGLFHADRRVLSQARLLVDDVEPEAVGHAPDGAGRARFVSLARWLGDPGPDPTVRLDRVRELTPYGMSEHVEISSTASVPVSATVTVELACDFAAIDTVKTGRVTGFPAPAAPAGRGRLTWRSAGAHVIVTGHGAEVRPGDEPRLTWKIDLPPRGRTTLSWGLTVQDPDGAVVVPATGAPEWSLPRVTAADRRLTRLLDQALADLRSLRLATPDAPDDTFLGAGVPWFLTLFGRDSIWAARMLLPLGTGLAAGTLRVLARRQGERLDPRSGEAPGKIMHELRRHATVLSRGNRLPAAYYGTIDATPLWISLLHDAWRWGLPEHEVEPLLPNLEAALGWLADHADPDRDGFLEYIDATGQGLANQGWKDSGDSIRFHDGSLAAPPIALAEVQGYAHQAALHGAALLDAFGRPGADRWREYAATLAGRFRAAFWVEGAEGRFPALALDRDKRPVDVLTSNVGHLLGTGLLTPEESAEVAGLLAAPSMAEGFGLRTMSAREAGFSPLSYHCGSIWPHDTAIVLAGLAREGFDTQAATLAEGLLAAAESFGYRLPELYGGDARHRVGRPVAYPAACRPQAWSAAAAIAIVHAALGLHPDVPAGEAILRPPAGAPLGALTVGGLRVAGDEVEVSVAHDGTATVTGLPDGMRLVQGW
ncbi:glycogen debranching N-terminal domain-containing protein [Nonomuraea sp. B12E4]|uniref:amylo-alpha-1,6-glucosidase n=1 Tax=Nonomuraea sp. B12E4 TaxID=3153564 RepID=UPI00325D4D5B